MTRLARLVEQIVTIIPSSRPVVFLDYPIYLNVGDSLIEAGTERFFLQLGHQVIERRSAYDFGAWARNRVAPETILVLQGGGNFGDLYSLHQEFREKVIAAFPENRIVMLPQTLHFDSQAKLAQCAQAFSRHKDLHVCLRDVKSLEIFRSRFDNHAYLVPDMAHFLWHNFSSLRDEPRGDQTLVFARRDKESKNLQTRFARGSHPPVDWNNLVGYDDKAACYLLEAMHRRRGRLGGSISLYPFWRIFRNRLIARSIDFLKDYDQIFTNRLHMGILGLLMGREVNMADNTYGKLSNYYSTWLDEVPGAGFAV